MPWPLSQDYNEAIQDPAASFADPELRRARPSPTPSACRCRCSGNFADVYQVRCPDGSRWAVKCFTREVPGLRERYAEISQYLQQAKLPFMVDFSFWSRASASAASGIRSSRCSGSRASRSTSSSANLDKPPMLEALLQIWARMAAAARGRAGPLRPAARQRPARAGQRRPTRWP